MLPRVQGKAYDLERYLPELMVDEAFRWQTLVRLLVGELARKLTGGRLAPRWSESVVAYYGQIAVFDKPDQHMGGLAFGRDFPRVLNELGIGRRGRMFEFCAGPGYIGYSLLAAGWCESLVLADIDPDAVSDGALHGRAQRARGPRRRLPLRRARSRSPTASAGTWSSSTPALPSEPNPDIRIFDPDWELHRRFYAVGRQAT